MQCDVIRGYSFMLRSPIQTANQIRRSYKNDPSNIFVSRKYNLTRFVIIAYRMLNISTGKVE